MNETEAQAELDSLVESVRRIADDWNDRGPMLLASAFQGVSLELMLDVLERLDSDDKGLYEACATLLLSRYTHDQGDLEIYRADLWAMVKAEGVHWPLRQMLAAVLDITRQQPRSHPNFEIYHALGLISEEVLAELDSRVATYPRRRRKRYAVNLARTAELPELSSLTFEPVDTRVGPRRKTGTLTGLPPSIALPSRYTPSEWVVPWHDLELDARQSELLLDQLPPLHALLENWDDTLSPLELVELLHGHDLGDLLLLSAALMPHRQQSAYLRYLSLLIHLKLLSVELPLLTETLRQIFGEASPMIRPLLPALAYYLYCSSHSFYGIQEQALKRLENRPSYLFQLILQEWAQNKRIRSFVRTWLSRQEQLAVKLLSAYDWEVIFFTLNRGWARSVVRDVYGMFHGSSAFANQIVQPDTSKGFGNLRESSGVSFLATRQISDLLRRQSRSAVDDQTRLQHFKDFVGERFRKDVLRKEQRPSLNVPTLKRLERYVTSLQQRAEQEAIDTRVLSCLGMKEVLTAFAYLTAERLEWLGYELTRLWLGGFNRPDEIEPCLTGLLQAALEQAEHDLSHRREGHEALARLLASMLDALLDHAIVRQLDPDQFRGLSALLGRLIESHGQSPLLPLYRQYVLAQQL
ncbi:MAG: hypothetical protein CVV27_00310 [Candidatus Melainabacteria bacterium HGW-Melainabacteria-1]|nr:MAG: hypothetical protein CVV27_00310 [Candidatus Melainabacteria bacterium HGW-Melainabacteria-1]